MQESQTNAVALFNYAHTYVQSAVTLEENETEATHWNAPIYFLYFHAIELYLKSFLVRIGHDLEDLRKDYGHEVLPLAELAGKEGVQFSIDDGRAIDFMSFTDNVISSRYIRVGTHQRLPFTVYFGLCQSLHDQIGWKVYEGSGVTRIPILREPKSSDSESDH